MPVRRPVRRPGSLLAAGTIAAPWVGFAAMRVLDADRGYPLAAFAAGTPYVAATAFVPILIALIMRRRVVALVGLVALVVLVGSLLPRVLDGPQPAERPTGPRLVVMSFNTLKGRADMAAVVRMARARDVDVLSLQELTPGGLARLEAAGIGALLPHRLADPRAGSLGTALLAKWPLAEQGMRSPPDLTAQPEAALAVPGAPPLIVKAVHPQPPVNSGAAKVWEGRLSVLPKPGDGDAAAEGDGDADDGPALRLLAGDFNATLDHRAFRALLSGGGYVDAADAVSAGLRPTWPAHSRFPGVTLDHVLVDPRIAVERFTTRELPASDHRAIVATLRLPSARRGR